MALEPTSTVSDQPVAFSARARRNLSFLWCAQFISKVGDQFFFVTAGMLALMLTNHAASAAGVAVASALPFLTIGLIAGTVVDRGNRLRIMIVTDLLRAVVFALVPLLWWFGVLEWWWLPVIAGLAFSCATFFDPARDALIPRIAEGASLVKVNAVFQTSIQAGLLFGPALLAFAGEFASAETRRSSGFAVALIGANALTFVVSACLLGFVRVPESGRRARAGSTLESLREGWALVRSDQRLRQLLLLTAVNNFFIMGPAIVGAQVLIHHDLGLSITEYGWFEASMVGGFLAGVLMVMRFGATWPRGRLLIGGMILDGLTYIPVGLAGMLEWNLPFSAYLGMLFVHGIFIPWIVIARTSVLQEYYPSEVHGRIFAFVGLTVTGFTALSSAMCGFLLDLAVSAHQLFFIAGVGGAAVGFAMIRARSIATTR